MYTSNLFYMSNLNYFLRKLFSIALYIVCTVLEIWRLMVFACKEEEPQNFCVR